MKNLLRYFIRNTIWVYVGLILMTVFGLIGLLNMKSTFFAPVDRRQVHIAVSYPGSSPKEIEESIVLTIEDKVKGINGIDRMTSKSMENSGLIIIEVKQGYDSDKVLEEVKNAVALNSGYPSGMEPPSVYSIPITDFAIQLAFYGEVSLAQLKKVVEQVEQDFMAIDGLSKIALSGYPDQEIQIEIPKELTEKYGITFEDLTRQIRNQNIDITGGVLKENREEFRIRANSKRYRADELAGLSIVLPGAQGVRPLDSIASVKLNWQDNPDRSFYNGKPAVIMTITKTIDEDILFITDTVKTYQQTFNQQNKNIQMAITRDGSVVLKQRIGLLTKNGLIGFGLVVLLLTALLNARLSFWVALGIPVSFLGLFIVGGVTGMTINVISLFGMVTVIGILVDDAIVIGENIFRKFEEGLSPKEAALEGTLEVIPSVVSAILTTVVAFMPFFFLKGRISEILNNMAFVVIVTLLVSLIEGLIFLPVHLAHSKGLRVKKKTNGLKRGIQTLFNAGKNGYERLLHQLIAYKYLAITIPFLCLIITILGFQNGIAKFTFFPFIDSDDITISLGMPKGTDSKETISLINQIERKVWEVNDQFSAEREDGKQVIQNITKHIKERGAEGQLSISLLDGESRNMESFKVTQAIREKVGSIPESEKLEIGSRMYFGKPVALALRSNNSTELLAATDLVKAQMRAHPKLRDVFDNNEQGAKEIRISLKPYAYLAGFTDDAIMSQVRQQYFGREIQRLQVESNEIKVWMRLKEEDRRYISNLETLPIKNALGQRFPLKSLADITIQDGIATIHHIDGSRQITLQADLTNAKEPVPAIIADVKQTILDPLKSQFPSIRYSFEGQKRQTDKTAKSARVVMPIMLLVMFLIVSIAFKSFFQAVVLFALIPFGIVGVAWGHVIHGMSISMLSIFGIIALIGIMVNDSIVFINAFNRNLRNGQPFKQALIDAAVSRFRPIVLTSLTTIAGLGPLIAEKSKQAQFLIPMAISITYGLLFATVLILCFLPLFMMGANRIRRLVSKERWVYGRWPSPESVEPAVRSMK